MKPHERLMACFQRLPQEQQQQLLEFAEFLDQRYGREEEVDLTPRAIARPEGESVVAAIKRLSNSYHMLDRSKMLHETSGLMAQHVMHGRDAVEVIDELEVLFRRYYEQQFGNP